MNNRNLLIFSVLLAFIFLAFSCLVIKDFSQPLIGYFGVGPGFLTNRDHVDFMEYPGFYLAKNLSFQPLPHLVLDSNQAFYPYGVNAVFQPWVLERDYFYAIFYSLFGTGGWLQLYYLFSIAIAALGTSLLLNKDYGIVRAIFTGLLVSFGNFYAVNKYPHHFNIAVLHWTTLGIIVDFLIFKKVIFKQHISLQFILLRLLLLILSLGQDLGYVAGFALMSFIINCLSIAIVIAYRTLTQGERRISIKIRQQVLTCQYEFIHSPKIHILLLVLIFIFTYLYLPLVIEISQAAKSPELSGSNSGAWWANSIRLFIPYLPIISIQDNLNQVFRDIPETVYDGRPGLYLVILGLLGCWRSRKNMIIFLPLIIIFLLCLVYNPSSLPTLKIFPWFAFNRVGGRSSLIYPIILAIFALHANLNWLKYRQRKIVACLLILLACLETSNAYYLKLSYQPYQLNANFYTYIDRVKNQPGEAVLDFPFCAKGGNRVGICPYYRSNGGIFALRRFHQKKVMGHFFGRLHPSQIEPYLQAGWDKLLIPNRHKSRQAKCFSDRQWSFFTDFYKYNDFAGINLYLDLLPKNCVGEFYRRFGKGAIETQIPEAGRVVFIPKSAKMRSQVNPILGKKIKLDDY
jgi:hypothetical protein